MQNGLAVGYGFTALIVAFLGRSVTPWRDRCRRICCWLVRRQRAASIVDEPPGLICFDLAGGCLTLYCRWRSLFTVSRSLEPQTTIAADGHRIG